MRVLIWQPLRNIWAFMRHRFGVPRSPQTVRTYTDRHGLKDLCRELLDVDLSKAQQSSDWGAPDLSDAQLNYAASDVLHLHALKDRLEIMLDREGRRPWRSMF